jgi:hypothetical protein
MLRSSASPPRVAYAVSKAGIGALVRHVASWWGPEGFRANGVGRPVDLAAVVTFLLSDDAAFLAGQVISVNGGIGSGSTQNRLGPRDASKTGILPCQEVLGDPLVGKELLDLLRPLLHHLTLDQVALIDRIPEP